VSEQKAFLKASSHYLLAQAIGLIASLLSFPIIARLLSTEEYGVLSLCNTILLFGVAVAKLGLQNAIARFYPDYSGKRIGCFYGTYGIVGAIAGLIVCATVVLASQLMLPQGYKSLGSILGILILGQSLSSYFVNFLRAEERSGMYFVLGTVSKYVSTFGGIAFLWWFKTGINGIFLAQVFTYCGLTLFLIPRFARHLSATTGFFSWTLVQESVKFGIPLLIFELSSILLAFSDRFLITWFNGARALGIYAAGYSISMYLGDLIKQPISLAVGPLIYRIYASEGRKKAQEMVAELLGIATLIIFPVFAGTMAVRKDLLIFLASNKYAAASDIIPWALGGILLNSYMPLVSTGLYLQKKTGTIGTVSVVCTLVNILLNVLLLPRYGIIGAAWSTAASYCLVVLWTVHLSAKIFPLDWPWPRIMKSAIAAVLMFGAVRALPSGTSLWLGILTGALVYPILLLALDRELRTRVVQMLQVNKS
jgi:O-antigen/teichoic acid export membrane protein